MNPTASSENSSVICLSANLSLRRPSKIFTIDFTSSILSGLKNTISSTLFRNSGLNDARSCCITSSFADTEITPPILPSSKLCEPILLVMMITVFLKSTTCPCESVILPSSSTCSKMLNTSGCAFSISSNRITLYGLRLTASVSCPPSSYPTYPGGAPTSRETECFSMYSLMSIRIMFSSVSKSASARVLASSVFPTPVGPKNMNDPIGLLGSFMPLLARRTASATNCTASSCPTTLL